MSYKLRPVRLRCLRRAGWWDNVSSGYNPEECCLIFWPWFDRTAEDVEDVRREVQIMHHLEGHPNIVKIFGAFEDKHSVHLVNAFPRHPCQLSFVGSDTSLIAFFSRVFDRAVAVERTSTGTLLTLPMEKWRVCMSALGDPHSDFRRNHRALPTAEKRLKDGMVFVPPAGSCQVKEKVARPLSSNTLHLILLVWNAAGTACHEERKALQQEQQSHGVA